MRQRATAIIVKDDKIILIKRIKNGSEYFIFPGGGVDEGETIEQGLVREVKEELCLDISTWKHLYDVEVEHPAFFVNKFRQKYFIYLISEYVGVPEIGGPEKESSNENNQYSVEWISIKKMNSMKNIYPQELVKNLAERLSSFDWKA